MLLPALFIEPHRARPGCTDDCRLGRGVKSGTSDSATDPSLPLGVGGAPLPARCFFWRAYVRRSKSSLRYHEHKMRV